MKIGAGALGVGLGLRPEFHSQIARERGRVDFLEVVTETCFEPVAAEQVMALRRTFPVVCHGINMSLGASEPLDAGYLARVLGVLSEIEPAWFSEHVAMTHVNGIDIGHLAPVGFTEATVETIVGKVKTVQSRAGLPMLVENVAYYFQLPKAELAEHELMTRIAQGADCGLLLDLNNLLANARNHRYDPFAYLDRIPLERVVEVHLAGGAWCEGLYIDTHGHAVEDEVWALLEYVCRRSSLKAILIERDVNVPPLGDVLLEVDRAREVARSAFG
jgi:uncharacterized protein (UPF0276 family)